MGEGQFIRPCFVEPVRCRNVLIEGVRVMDSANWVLHPLYCTNVTIRGVTVDSHGTRTADAFQYVYQPLAGDGQIVARDVMHVSVTSDHRVVDGREAAEFAYEVIRALEDPTRLFLRMA